MNIKFTYGKTVMGYPLDVSAGLMDFWLY